MTLREDEDFDRDWRLQLERIFVGPPWMPPRLIAVFGLPLLVYALSLPGGFADPFLRASSLAQLLGDTGPSFAQTLTEGRWLVWVWALEADQISPQGHLWIALGLWALVSTLLALAIFRDDPLPGRAMLTALALSLAPPLAGQFLAPPEIVPAFAVMAVYALLLLLVPMSEARVALLILVPLGMAAAAFVPLALFAMLMVAGSDREPGRGKMIDGLAMLLGGLVVGAALLFVLNLAVHGVVGFGHAGAAAGLPPDGPLTDVLLPWLIQTAHGHYGPWPFLGVGSVALALVLLFLARASEADRLLGAFGLMLVAAALQTAISGRLPTYAESLPLWILAVGALALAARKGRLALASPVLMVGLAVGASQGLSEWRWTLAHTRVYQDTTAEIASDVAEAVRDIAGPIVIAGSPGTVAGAEVLTEFRGLALRLSLLTGRRVVQCPDPDPLCAAHRATLAQMPPRPLDGWLRLDLGEAGETALLLRLPDGVFAPVQAR
ncbi:MAG: hypothetical protein ACFBRM_07525 [Pikeienuella sp.]